MLETQSILDGILDFVQAPTFGLSLGVFIITFVSLYVLKFVLINRISSFASNTKTDLDDFLVELINIWNFPSILALSLLLFIQFYGFEDELVILFDTILLVGISVYVVRTIQKIISYSLTKSLKKSNPSDKIAISAINTATGIILYTTLILVILQNFGVNITTLITGLGVGGIAIAFALQNILGDIFSAFTLYFDRPFGPGDVIDIGGDIGEVKKVGLKSTRVKTLQGEELIISNQELTSVKIRNYNKMRKRRVVMNIGIIYETDKKLLKQIPSLIEKIITKEEQAEFDRAHLFEFGDFSLNYEIVFFILSKDYNVYMDTRQTINLAIIDIFEKKGIEFAYPTSVQYNRSKTTS
jgi:small-conductance mechanosensitive channel